jgi:hypothetical protein
VTFPILDCVRFIPIESDTLAKRVARSHSLYISHIHNSWKVFKSLLAMVKLLKVLDLPTELLD